MMTEYLSHNARTPRSVSGPRSPTKTLSDATGGRDSRYAWIALSKVESEKLDFALYPGEKLVRKLATALETDETELLLLAKKVPPLIRDRVLQRPDDFRKLASLDDDALDEVMRQVDRRKRARA